jgi:hypothetical protein
VRIELLGLLSLTTKNIEAALVYDKYTYALIKILTLRPFMATGTLYVALMAEDYLPSKSLEYSEVSILEARVARSEGAKWHERLVKKLQYKDGGGVGDAFGTEYVGKMSLLPSRHSLILKAHMKAPT